MFATPLIYDTNSMSPERIDVVFTKDTPNPFGRMHNIKHQRVNDTKSARVFWIAHLRPTYPVILVFVSHPFSEDLRKVLVKTYIRVGKGS